MSDLLSGSPHDNPQRAILRRTTLFDMLAEEAFDRLTRLAARWLNAPISLVSLVDEDRHFYKSCVGLPEPYASRGGTPASQTFCQHTIASGEPLVIADARQHPLVKNLTAIRDLPAIAYVGIPLITSVGEVLGSFCVIDHEPRRWTEEEVKVLRDLAASVVTEIELRIATAEKEKVLESIADCFFSLDEAGRFTYLNPAANDFFQDTLHEKANILIGKSIWEVFPEAVGTRFYHAQNQAVQEQTTVEVEGFFPNVRRWVCIRVYPSNGGLSVLFQDVTEDKESEKRATLLKQAQEAEARYRTLFNSAADIILVADADSHYVDVNSAAEKTLGYSRVELLTMSVADVVAHGMEWTEAEYAAFVRDGFWHGELQIRRRDGSLLPVEAQATEIPLPQGSLYLSILRDITERKQAEAQLREETQLVETLYHVGNTLIGELDLHKLVQSVTDATTSLIRAQFGAFFYNVVNEDNESYTLYTLSGVPHEAFARYPMPRKTAIFGPTFDGESIVRSADITQDARYGHNSPYYGMPEGHLPVKSYLAVPVFSRSGEVLGGLFFGHSEPGIFAERDERIVGGIAAQAAVAIDNARLFDDAQKAIRARDAFLSLASHELRTPLTTLKGYIDLLQRRARQEGTASERDQRTFNILQTQAVRIEKLITSLLDISRIEMGQLTLDVEQVDLTSLVRRIVAEREVATEHHTLQWYEPDEAIVIRGDTLRLEQVLQNLMKMPSSTARMVVLFLSLWNAATGTLTCLFLTRASGFQRRRCRIFSGVSTARPTRTRLALAAWVSDCSSSERLLAVTAGRWK